MTGNLLSIAGFTPDTAGMYEKIHRIQPVSLGIDELATVWFVIGILAVSATAIFFWDRQNGRRFLTGQSTDDQ